MPKQLVAKNRDEFCHMHPLSAMLHKFDGWSYEDEWRLIHESAFVEPDRNQSAAIPSRVFLGSRFEVSAGKELFEICAAKKIQISRMRLADDRFELLAEEFTP
jgi:hypothetical protein